MRYSHRYSVIRALIVMYGVILGISTVNAAVVVGTGWSKNSTAAAAANEACTQAKNDLGGTPAKVVVVWDTLHQGMDVYNAVKAQFPNALVCGQKDWGAGGYSAYTEDGTTIDTDKTVGVLAIGGDVEASTQYVTGVNGGMAQGAIEAKGAELGNKLNPLPQDVRLIILMGTLHNPGMVHFTNGLKTVIPAQSPVIGGASSDWGGQITRTTPPLATRYKLSF